MEDLTAGTGAPPTPRQCYIDGLRLLASVLENHPEVPLPYDGHANEMSVYFLSGDDPRTEMIAAARAIPCAWRKSWRDGDEYSPGTFSLSGELGALKIKLTAYREAVCERVVTGTREVTEQVQDPEALKAVPLIEVTRVVEDVTWDCGSLLRPGLPASAPKAVSAA